MTLQVRWCGQFSYYGNGRGADVELGCRTRSYTRPYKVIEVVSVLVPGDNTDP